MYCKIEEKEMALKMLIKKCKKIDHKGLRQMVESIHLHTMTIVYNHHFVVYN
jgi:hypothetical protein